MDTGLYKVPMMGLAAYDVELSPLNHLTRLCIDKTAEIHGGIDLAQSQRVSKAAGEIEAQAYGLPGSRPLARSWVGTLGVMSLNSALGQFPQPHGSPPTPSLHKAPLTSQEAPRVRTAYKASQQTREQRSTGTSAHKSIQSVW